MIKTEFLTHNKYSKLYRRTNRHKFKFPNFQLNQNTFTTFDVCCFGVHPERQRQLIWEDFQNGLKGELTETSDNYYNWFKQLIEVETEVGEVTIIFDSQIKDSGIVELIFRAIEWLKTQI